MDGSLKKVDISVGGFSRKYFYHLPDSVARGANSTAPIVMMLHGGGGQGGQGADIDKLSHWIRKCGRVGCLPVFPNAYSSEWNDGRQFGGDYDLGVDDVQYIRAVLTDVRSRLPQASPSRAFSAGISNGAAMTLRLLCDASDVVVAGAAVANYLPELLAPACNNRTRARPVLVIGGTDDPLVPFAGGCITAFTGTCRGRVLSYRETLDFWAANCTNYGERELPEVEDDGTRVTEMTHSGCPGNTTVVGYEIEGGGHTWPDGCQYLPKFIVGAVSRNLDATDVIWEFFGAAPP